MQPTKDKKGFSEPLLTVPSAIPPGLSIQSVDWSLKTLTELDFVRCQCVLWKNSEKLDVEGRRVERDMRLKRDSEDEPTYLPAMDVKKQVTALPGRGLRGWEDGGRSGDDEEDTAMLSLLLWAFYSW